MQNEIIEKMTDMGKSSFSAMQELAAINSRAFKELSELQVTMATYSMESGVELTKTLGTSKNYKDALSAEMDFASEYGSKVLEFGSKTTEILTDSRDEVVSLFEKAVEEASVEAAPVTAKKPVRKAS